MSDRSIDDMSFRELKNEVQELRDDLAKMRRMYEDLLYNLDEDNFSGRLKKTLVEKFDSYSTIEQTADAIRTAVSMQINIADAEEVEDTSYMQDTSKIYYVTDEKTYYRYNSVSEEWEVIDTNVITSLFEQTADGFKLKGDVNISSGSITWSSDDSPVKVKYSATAGGDYVEEYNPSTHYFAIYSYDNGSTWTSPIKIRGEDGQNGHDGNSVNVADILRDNYGITSTNINQDSIESPIINSARLYSPEIYGMKFKTYQASGSTTFPSVSFYNTNEEFIGALAAFGNYSISLYPAQHPNYGNGETCILYIGNAAIGCKTMFFGELDFSNANVSGLGVVPVFG